MKKLMYLLLLVVSFGLISCNGLETGIIGHTFDGVDEAGYRVTLSFRPDMICHVKISYEDIDTDAFTYTVTNTKVRIYYDESDIWKKSFRGQLTLEGTYNDKRKELTITMPGDSDYMVLTRIK